MYMIRIRLLAAQKISEFFEENSRNCKFRQLSCVLAGLLHPPPLESWKSPLPSSILHSVFSGALTCPTNLSLYLPDFGRCSTACHWAFRNPKGTVLGFIFSFFIFSPIIFSLLLFNKKNGPMQQPVSVLVPREIRCIAMITH